jgi:hypothetical protein
VTTAGRWDKALHDPRDLPTAVDYLVPKRASTVEQCDDSVEITSSPEPGDAPGGGRLVVAIADGASESLLSGAWARRLTGNAVRLIGSSAGAAPSPRTLAEIAGRSARQWPDFLDQYIAGRERDGRPLRWYEQPGLERGAHSTLAVLELCRDPAAGVDGTRPAEGWTWTAAAVGDSCAFHIRDGKLLAAVPIARPEEFDLSPDLLGSRDPDLALIAARTRVGSGYCEPGDRLYLATDALAAWILTAARDGGPGWDEELREFAAAEQEERAGLFGRWVEARRADGSLRNDDVAFAHLDFELP